MANENYFRRIFSVFSKRNGQADVSPVPLTSQCRFGIAKLLLDTFASYELELWESVHSKLQYTYAKPRLSRHRNTGVVLIGRSAGEEAFEDIRYFLSECSDAHFFDFVELLLQSFQPFRNMSMSAHKNWVNPSELVETINVILEEDSLPYTLTNYAYEKSHRPQSGTNRLLLNSSDLFSGPRIIQYPKIIRRDSEVAHRYAIKPALDVLADPNFQSVNDDFRKALQYYRQGGAGEYEDCVTRCYSALESAMKIICDSRDWNAKGKPATLLKSILAQVALDPPLEQLAQKHLDYISALRSNKASAHGQGTSQRTVSKQEAQFIISATTSLILLLVTESKS